MKKKANITTKRKNKRLNVIFFLDSEKTRSFSISRTWLITAMTLLLCGVAWSGASAFLISKFIEREDTYQTKVEETLSALFQYKSKYSDMYETTYPNQRAKQSAQPIAKKTTSSKKPLVKTIAQGKAVPQAKIKLAKKSTPKIRKFKAPQIQSTSFSLNKRNLTVKFSIQNKMSHQKANGRVWVVAAVKNQKTSKTDFIVRPSAVKLLPDGKAKGILGSLRFNIRNFKTEKMVLAIPQDTFGQILHADVYLSDSKGTLQKKRIVVNKMLIPPLKKEVPQLNPELIPKKMPSTPQLDSKTPKAPDPAANQAKNVDSLNTQTFK